MNERDKKIMKILLEDKDNKYRVVVDNDCIIVVDTEREETIHNFWNYGQELIVELFKYIGIDAEEC